MSIPVIRNSIASAVRRAALTGLVMERLSGSIEDMKALTKELQELAEEHKNLIKRIRFNDLSEMANQVFEKIQKSQGPPVRETVEH